MAWYYWIAAYVAVTLAIVAFIHAANRGYDKDAIL